MILQLMKSLYAHDVIDDLPLSVFLSVVIFRKKGQITISSDPSPLFGIQFLAIPFAFDFAFKMHIKEKT